MAVEIDRRVAGLLNEVRRCDQSRSRAIVEYAWCSVLGSHAAARSNLRHARWTGRTWLDRRRALSAGLRGESAPKECRSKDGEKGDARAVDENGHDLTYAACCRQ